MKYLARLSLLLLSASAFATNGNHFIGVSPASNSLSGTGVANFTNSLDALHKNPALMTRGALGQRVNAEASFQLIDLNASANGGAGLKDSSAAMKLAPSFGATYAYNDNLAVGLAILGFGGATVDQVGALELNQLQTRNSLLRLVPAVAYRISDLVTVSIAPYLSYGSLAINHSNPPSSAGAQTTRPPHSAVGFGGQIGAAFHPLTDLTLGVTYNSESNIKYKDVLNLDAFGPAALVPATAAATIDLDTLEAQEPQELAVGASYLVTPDILVTADYRFINWSQANVFRDLGWQDQHVIAFGAQYRMSAWRFRAGFNYGKSPIRDTSLEAGTTPVNIQGHNVFQQSISLLNLAAFPAVVESHVTLGAAYDVNEDFSVDLGGVLGLKNSITRSGTGAAAYSYTGEASQFSVLLGATYRL
jgi:long-chain fatty acid transport protein